MTHPLPRFVSTLSSNPSWRRGVYFIPFLKPPPAMFLLENLRDFILGPREFKVLFTGLEGAGTSSILHRLYALSLLDHPDLPPQSFQSEFHHKRCKILGIDGVCRMRDAGYHSTKAIVFVVDSSRRELFPEAREELFKLLRDPRLQDCKLLVFNHKIDKKGSVSSVFVIDELGLLDITDREWYVQSSTIQGHFLLHEGIDRLYQSVMGYTSMSQERKTAVIPLEHIPNSE